MNRVRGFTLVELLVVMAIIAILASIVVPNVARYIERGRVTKATSEVKSIELALTTMLADAQRGDLNHLLNASLFQNDLAQIPSAVERFAEARRVYNQVFTSLLRFGRGVYTEGINPGVYLTNLTQYLNRDVILKLGTSYLDIQNDPWGSGYQIFPGPWSGAKNENPIIFRKFTAETGETRQRSDAFILNKSAIEGYLDFPDEFPDNVSYPADRDKTAFVWSYGANLTNSQMVYQTWVASDPATWFTSMEAENIGGGDDINNWDSGQNWAYFYR